MKEQRVENIVKWIERIETSDLSVSKFLKTRNVPFSRAQYFNYKRRLEKHGSNGLMDRRLEGNNRKLTPKHEVFLKGCVSGNPEISLAELQQSLMDEFHCEISLRSIDRALVRINVFN